MGLKIKPRPKFVKEESYFEDVKTKENREFHRVRVKSCGASDESLFD